MGGDLVRSKILASFKSVGCLLAVSIFLLSMFEAPCSASASERGDAFLAGYVSSILERDLHWNRESYRVTVVDKVATVTLLTEDTPRGEAAEKVLRAVEGLRDVVVVVAASDSGKPGAGSGVPERNPKGKGFPSGDLFRPLLADPKQPQFFASLGRFESLGTQYSMAEAGFGETFGMYRWFLGRSEGDGLQLSVEASLVARFNMSTASMNLINADYTVGIPLTYRSGNSSIRLRLYHQSSHLGDEFLESANPPKRMNLSFESIEVLYSYEWRGWRGYAGGEYLIHKDPAELKPAMAHWGIEYRGKRPLLWTGRLVGGVDLKSYQQHEWAVDTSVKIGLEFGKPNPGQRRLRLMAEWYRGYDPRGQFYMNKVSYYGMTLCLGF